MRHTDAGVMMDSAMDIQHYDLHGIGVAELTPAGWMVKNDRDAVDVIAAAAGRSELIVIPVSCLTDDFFRLRTGVAGSVVQKFVTYGPRLVILGDIRAHINESSAFRDFVYECNAGAHIWFLKDKDELKQRLGG